MSVVFRPADAAAPPASVLIEAMIAELVDLYGRIDGPGTPSATPADLAPPAGGYLVGWDGPDAVAGGGFKRLDATTAEIKRMYIVPARRGGGLGRALLSALEAAARSAGYTRVRLDTGVHQAVARGLYERSGYVAIPDYNANPHASYWGEKDLTSGQ